MPLTDAVAVLRVRPLLIITRPRLTGIAGCGSRKAKCYV
jgi:hypothetical protein